jgi:hypothetical protein
MKCIYFLLFIFAFISCKKSTTTPVPTQNTVVFTSNGINYSVTGDYDYFRNSWVSYSNYGSNSNEIHMYFYTGGGHVDLAITVDGPMLLNTKMSMRNKSSSIFFDKDIDPVTGTHYFDTTTSYVIFTQFDSKTTVGTFQCNGIGSGSDTVNVTNGKFYLFN